MNIPLVRTEGKDFPDGPTLQPELFVELPMLRRASKSAVARKAETELDLGDSLYFFAGHACPDFGDLVLAYEPDMADSAEGSATPFDTGGLSEGHVQAQALDTGEEKAAYTRRHLVELRTWREDVEAYIAEYFPSKEAYVKGGKPSRNDPSGRLHHPENHDRRAWTWEIRLWRDHPIEQSLRKAWCSRPYFRGIRLALRKSSSKEARHCADLITSRRLVQAPRSTGVHAWAELEIATSL
jgi:hypothetical protein